MKIEGILATKGGRVVTIGPEEPLREALALLAQYNIGALAVVDEGGRLIGIISERDIAREAAHNDHLLGTPVRAVMTRDVIVGSPQDDVQSVVHSMTEKRFRHLPILDEGRLVGIISIGDVVKATLDQYQGEIDTLQTQISAGQPGKEDAA